MTDHGTHKNRYEADREATASRLILAQLNSDADGWYATWNELGDCPDCMRNVAAALTAQAAEALSCFPNHEHDDCELCEQESDPDAETADKIANHLAYLLDFIAKRRSD
jgi:hypothetical protein